MWLPIPGYEGLYEANKQGEIKSLSRTVVKNNYPTLLSERILKQYISDTGYCVINLHSNGKQKLQKVHRIIASLFVPNPNNFKVVNHKNGIKTDNRSENLEWCTQKHNVREAFKLELMGSVSKLHGKIITEAVYNGFRSCDIARYFKIHPTTVRRIYHRMR